jgi:hypothetical protein
MASVYTAQTIRSNNPIVAPNQAGIVYVSKGRYTVSAAFVINDIVKLNVLPAGCVPLDFLLGCTDLDGATTMTVSVGLWDGTTGLTASTNFITESDVAQAGGIARATVLDFLTTIQKATTDRYIALKVVAAPTGTAVTSGYIWGILTYEYAQYGF